ncbi:hypothetical protein F4810DRAFT_705542 [Camillea tinctor]|nr:hypothetical protein F4810DRAFT_705542 [Camillea tinctor]
MRILLLPPSLVLSLLLQTAPTIVRALENDFSAYPSDSQQCLYDAADQTSCTGNTGAELNQCLCRNKGNFIDGNSGILCLYNTATCVAKTSPSDLVAVWETLDYNCDGTGVTIAVSKDAFLAQASAVISSSTPTATATASPSSSDAASTPGTMSSTAKIGIGVGIGFGTVSLGLAAWFVWLYSRRRRAAEKNGATAIPPGSSAGPWAPSTEYTNSYGMAATSTPSVEFAHMNHQGGAVELPNPREEWKHTAFGHGARKTNSTADMPLLAELGEGAGQVAPVELPGSTVEDQQHYQQQQQQQHHQEQQSPKQEHQEHENDNRDTSRYSDQSIGQQLGPGGIGQRSVSPVDGISPTVYSQVAAHDVSPYSTYSSHY